MSSAAKLVRSATAKVVAPKKPTKPKAKTPVHKETVVGVSEPASKAMTTFQSRVYALTQKIPKGYVTTYGAVAEILHSAPRAVGQALARNPFAPTVPCHRVIAQTGLGGFFGNVEGKQLERKLKLLTSEGVRLADDGKSSSDKITFTSAIIEPECILDGDALRAKLAEANKGFHFSSEAKAPAASASV